MHIDCIVWILKRMLKGTFCLIQANTYTTVLNNHINSLFVDQCTFFFPDSNSTPDFRFILFFHLISIKTAVLCGYQSKIVLHYSPKSTPWLHRSFILLKTYNLSRSSSLNFNNHLFFCSIHN